jgi:hypothetical protein
MLNQSINQYICQLDDANRQVYTVMVIYKFITTHIVKDEPIWSWIDTVCTLNVSVCTGSKLMELLTMWTVNRKSKWWEPPNCKVCNDRTEVNLTALTVRLKCFVLKNIRVLSSTCGECAPSCLLSHRCSSSTLVTMYSARKTSTFIQMP